MNSIETTPQPSAAPIAEAPAPQAASAPAPPSVAPAAPDRMRAAVEAALNPKPLAPERDLPPAIAEMRAGDAGRRMVPPAMMYAAVDVGSLFESSETAKEDTRDLVEVLADHRLTVSEAAMFVNLAKEVRRARPSEATIEAWTQRNQADLAMRYGDRLEAVMADARRLVERDPRVSDYLRSSGLSNHPSIVKMMIEKAATLKSLGQLK